MRPLHFFAWATASTLLGLAAGVAACAAMFGWDAAVRAVTGWW